MKQSLRLRLPLLMSALIAAMLGAFLFVAYREVESALLQAGGVRAQGVADQLGNLLAQQAQQRIADVERAAQNGSVRAYLHNPSDAAADAARPRLSALNAAGQPGAELWNNVGERLLVVPGPPPTATSGVAPEMPVGEAPSKFGLSAFQIVNGVMFYDTIAEINEESSEPGESQGPTTTAHLGYVVSRRVLASSSSSSASSEAISKLVGNGAIFKLGNQADGVWTNLQKVVAAPPADASQSGVSQFRADDGESRLAARTPIRGTPWAVWIEFSRSAFVAPARVFLTRMLIFALGFVVVAALLARWLSARITTPLLDLTHAAEAIAAGQSAGRVAINRRDEVGRLGTAFNTMAAQVRAVQRELEERVQQRTARLAETAADLEQHIADLNETRQDLDRFFALSLDMLCIAGLDGYFKRLNPAWSATLGWADDELRGKPYLDFVHLDDREATIRQAGQLAEGTTVVTFENRYACRDGSYRWLQWKAVPALDRKTIYAAARDITDQKTAESNIQALNDQLAERVSELHALTGELESFSYSVSHDLRAPLRHVMGFASLLEKSAGPTLDDRGRRYVKTIADAASRMGRLIDDLIVFSRMGRSEMLRGRVQMGGLVEEVRQEVSADVKDRHIEWRIHALPTVTGDPAMLRLVLTNLISNALKYSAPRPTTEIEIGCNGTPEETVLFVRDNGVGFDMQYAHKLFGVFQRLHSSDDFEGTGIGLANVRRIVQRHGGRVWAESAVDAGATFYFSLPQTGEAS